MGDWVSWDGKKRRKCEMVSLVEMGVGDVLGMSRDRNEDEVMNHEELDFWSVYVSVRFMCTALYLYKYLYS
jgi:hypothetical protein